jgi:hypothetical protein
VARNDTSRSIAHRYLSYCATTTAPDNPGGLVLGGNSNDGWMDVESKGQFFGTVEIEINAYKYLTIIPMLPLHLQGW